MEHTEGKLKSNGNWIGIEGEPTPIVVVDADWKNWKENASRIVKTWNCHDELVEENKKLREAIGKIQDFALQHNSMNVGVKSFLLDGIGSLWDSLKPASTPNH